MIATSELRSVLDLESHEPLYFFLLLSFESHKPIIMKVTVLPKEMDNIIKRNRCVVKLNNKQTCHHGLSQI